MQTIQAPSAALTREQLAFFQTNGYLIVRGVFSAAEVAELRGRFERLESGAEPAPDPGVWQRNPAATDPLERCPRVMFPHRWDALSKRWLLDPRLRGILHDLLGEEAIAAQSMFYFKPPGARGQALHQDNFYLQVEPQSCMAAWIALDPSTPANGGLMVVPQTQAYDLVCPEQADMTQSAFVHLVRPPEGKRAVPAEMQPGDVLFFNGNIIHGSEPNRSATQWRRSYILHYLPASSRCINAAYFPLLDFDGNEVKYAASTSGGPCGIEFKKPTYGA